MIPIRIVGIILGTVLLGSTFSGTFKGKDRNPPLDISSPPMISIVTPVSGSTLSGSVTLSASASDDNEVTQVVFRLDGANLGKNETTNPYSITWDTTTATNGSHSIVAVARDREKNESRSAKIMIIVDNTVSTTKPIPVPTPTPTLVPTVASVVKPTGIYSSADAKGSGIYQNDNLKGVLIRASWAEIEPSPGVFDFSKIESSLDVVRAKGQSWSLGILGGPKSPSWLTDTLGASYIEFLLRGTTKANLPLFWDSTVQKRLKMLADRIGKEYNNDPSLKLVYVTQMSSNGIEGHLQHIDMVAFKNKGYTDDKWVDAAKQTAKNFANAFPSKPIAFEVHDVNGGATVPNRIINDLWNDPSLNHRVGAAMWWLSGRVTYQSALLDILKKFPGDIYGQVIAYSGDSSRQNEFGTGGFKSVFPQAKELDIRYIEVWENELKTGNGTAKGAWDVIFKDFNVWAASTN